MKSLNNKRIFILVVVLLTLINLGFVISVVIMQRQFRQNHEMHPVGMMEGPRHFMQNEVGFNEEQMNAFHDLRNDFRTRIEPLHKDLRTMKSQLITEATSESPDTVKCNLLSNRIGEVHAEINHLTSLHLMQVSKLATPEQEKKLKQFYIKMLSDGPADNPGQGRQYRHRGQRRIMD